MSVIQHIYTDAPKYYIKHFYVFDVGLVTLQRPLKINVHDDFHFNDIDPNVTLSFLRWAFFMGLNPNNWCFIDS